jgi:hypothetical protein
MNTTATANAPSFATEINLKPQTRQILRHLRKESISPLEALTVYGISRLAPAIYDLRQAGYTIRSEHKRDAMGHNYTRYTLVLNG